MQDETLHWRGDQPFPELIKYFSTAVNTWSLLQSGDDQHWWQLRSWYTWQWCLSRYALRILELIKTKMGSHGESYVDWFCSRGPITLIPIYCILLIRQSITDFSGLDLDDRCYEPHRLPKGLAERNNRRNSSSRGMLKNYARAGVHCQMLPGLLGPRHTFIKTHNLYIYNLCVCMILAPGSG